MRGTPHVEDPAEKARTSDDGEMSGTRVGGLVIPMLRSGTLVLRSGAWTWQLDLDGDRFRLLFALLDGRNDEMIAYCRRAAVTAEVVITHARRPLRRHWTDFAGARWELGVEAPGVLLRTTMSGAEGGENRMWIIFEGEKGRRFTWVPSDLELGELSDAEIARLLTHSEPLAPFRRSWHLDTSGKGDPWTRRPSRMQRPR